MDEFHLAMTGVFFADGLRPTSLPWKLLESTLEPLTESALILFLVLYGLLLVLCPPPSSLGESERMGQEGIRLGLNPTNPVTGDLWEDSGIKIGS